HISPVPPQPHAHPPPLHSFPTRRSSDLSDGLPVRFTISLRLAELEHPGVVAERLPKALIHRNIPGERIHDLLQALDREWERAAPMSTFGAVQRWLATVAALKAQGIPVHGDRRRWRLGELTVPWSTVTPLP